MADEVDRALMAEEIDRMFSDVERDTAEIDRKVAALLRDTKALVLAVRACLPIIEAAFRDDMPVVAGVDWSANAGHLQAALVPFAKVKP